MWIVIGMLIGAACVYAGGHIAVAGARNIINKVADELRKEL